MGMGEHEDSNSPAGAPDATAGIRFPPPLLFAAALALGWAAGVLWPVDWFPGFVGIVVGVGLVAAGTILFAAGVREFRRHGAHPDVRRPVPAVIRTGVYRFSRNPLYLAMIAVTAGIGIWAGNPWILAALVPAVWILRRVVIDREEAYLAARFGSGYESYRAGVRRWL